ncbi:MAG: hypothetical protein K0S77_2393 [Pseudomonas sp.]|nr:hypothetical protein [Pseudomonas sp.]
MSAASNVVSLLEHLLPERIAPLISRPRQRQRLLAGVGIPSQHAALGERFSLIDRLDEAGDLQQVYLDLREQALHGSVAALNDLGWIWLNGKYWRADPLLASHLLRMAALQGSAAAWFNLGQQHYFGKGVEVSYSNAARYYRQAFERGMAHAAAALGDLFEEEVVEPGADWQVDLNEAYQWFLRGARQGEARCRFEVGYRLLHGLHVEADAKTALYWLEQAAVAGVMPAAEELAVHFSSVDPLRYLYWRDQAIDMGSTLALTMRLEDQIQP